MGKSLLVLAAAAALYLATVEHGLNIAKTMVTDAAEVSMISLRKRLTDILQDAWKQEKATALVGDKAGARQQEYEQYCQGRQQ
jgi:transcription initiation factor TFIIIB Brf1 subunit/transcription initiation factor TFIIB